MILLPPHGHCRTSLPNVCWCRVAQSTRGRLDLVAFAGRWLATGVGGSAGPGAAVTRLRSFACGTCLNRLLLEPLEVVFSHRRRELTPIGPRLAESSVENSGHVVVSRRVEFDALPRIGPAGLRHQDLQMRRQMKSTPKPLREADARPQQESSLVPGPLGLLPLPPPDGLPVTAAPDT